MRVDRRLLLPALLCLVVIAGGIGILMRSGGPDHDLLAGSQPSIGREIPVTAMNIVATPANNSPALARDPTDDRFLALANRRDGPQFGCALDASYDGGRSWVPVQPVAKLPSGADRCYAPEVDFDRAGHLYYLFVGLHGAGNAPIGVYLTTSPDRGSHFSSPRQVLGAERYQVRMVIDRDHGDGRLHLVWLEARSSPTLGGFGPTPNPIMSAYSDDGGATFSHPQQASDPDRQRVVAPAVAVTSDHELHVLYYDLGNDARDYEGLEGPVWDGAWTLVLSTSHDAGAHFDRGVVVDASVAPIQRAMLIYTLPPPALAVDSTHVYAAWHDARNGDWDVLFRTSSDGGATWTQPRRLNDDPIHDGRHQYLPRLSVAPTGRLDAIFYDRRGDKFNVANDVYYTYSTDQGNTFSRNLKITSLPSLSLIGPQYANTSAQGLVEFGGRLALASDADGVVAAWTDTRNDERSPRAQDIFSASLQFATSEPLAWWRALGLTLCVGGGAVSAIIAVGWWRARTRPSPPFAPGPVGGAGVEGRSIARVQGVRRLPHAELRLAAAAVIRRPPLLCPGLVVCLTLTSCSPTGSPHPSAPTIEVTMREFSFEYSAPQAPGRAVFHMTNAGHVDHRLTLVPLADDFPEITTQLRGKQRRFITEQAGIPDRPPGADGTFAADLTRGRYAFICFTTSPDGVSHGAMGMASEFRIR